MGVFIITVIIERRGIIIVPHALVVAVIGSHSIGTISISPWRVIAAVKRIIKTIVTAQIASRIPGIVKPGIKTVKEVISQIDA